MSPPLVAWLDGGLQPREALHLPAGLRQGDGVFETIRTYSGTPFRLADHLDRLLGGARSIDLPDPPSRRALGKAVESTLAACRAGSSGAEWVLRPSLFSEDGRTGSLVLVDPLIDPVPPSGVASVVAGLSQYPHPGRYLLPPSTPSPVKWLARGPLSHALRDARARGWDEALLLNGEGGVVEGTRSNLFVLQGERFLAPGPASGALPGITRGIVVDLARARGIEVEDRPPRPEQLAGSPEAFLTSTLLGVAPISLFQGVPVGSGAEGGRHTRELREAFGDLVRRETRPRPVPRRTRPSA
ncbi:MAG: aminotransferase class IV [Thermoplasmata archaeon]